MEIPNGWSTKKVANSIKNISLTGRKLPLRDYLVVGKYPVIDQGQKFIGGYTDQEDLVVQSSLPVIVFGDHTKAIKYIDFPFVAGADGVKVLKPLDFFHPKLLYYFLQVIDLPDKGYARHYQYLEKSEVPLPPIPEQERIVARIESLFTQLEAGVAALKRARVALKRYKASVLKAACEGRLVAKRPRRVTLRSNDSEIPNGWRWTTIEEISQVDRPATYGILKPGDYFSDGVPMLRIVDIKNGVINLSNVHKASRKLSDAYKRTILQGGECLISLVGTIGLSAYVPDTLKGINVHRNIGVIAPSQDVSGKYLDICLKSAIVQSQIREFTTGANQPLFNIRTLKRVLIPLPPLAEQHRIVAEVERRLSVVQELEQTIEANLKRAGRLRQAVLKMAFEGRLVS
jgi:type I restriction enzyme S subunit